MRIQDLTEGFASGFEKGYGSPLLGKSSSEKKAASAARSPFSGMSNREIKNIIYKILNGQELDNSEKRQLLKIYNNL